MKIAQILAIVTLLCGCYAGSTRMSNDDFAMIQIGTPFKDVQKRIGDPFVSRVIGDNTVEYEYIERIYADNRLYAENHYFITVKGGKVVGKRTYQEVPPSYNIIYSEDPNFSPS